MELLPKKTEGNDPNSQYFSWHKVGDTISGLYIDYEQSAGQYNKPQMTLKTKTGKKLVSCSPIDLRKRVEDPAMAGDLDGLWITITFTGEEDTGKESKKKVFKVTAEPKPAGAKVQHEAGPEVDEKDLPF